MKRTAVGFAAVLLGIGLGGCGDAKPCTTCPNVAGTYLSVAPHMPPEKSSCGTLFSNPSTHEIQVVQNGSELTVTDFLGVEGVLYDSLWTDFEPVTVTTGGDLNTDATMQLTGRFSGEEGARVFDGTMHFKVVEDGCTLDVPVTWTQTDPDAI